MAKGRSQIYLWAKCRRIWVRERLFQKNEVKLAMVVWSFQIADSDQYIHNFWFGIALQNCRRQGKSKSDCFLVAIMMINRTRSLSDWKDCRLETASNALLRSFKTFANLLRDHSKARAS
jgi:hypothetical protein